MTEKNTKHKFIQRRNKFIEYYCLGNKHSATEAARKAGVSAGSASTVAYRYMQDEEVKRLIDEKMEQISTQTWELRNKKLRWLESLIESLMDR